MLRNDRLPSSLLDRELIAQCKSNDLECIGKEILVVPENQQVLLKAQNPKGF